MKKYTKEQLIYYLKKLSYKLAKTPTLKDVNAHKEVPSSSTYLKRFESWNNALRSAGLKINVKKQFLKEELLENLKMLAKELQRTPKPRDLKGKSWAGSYSTYKKHFGKWKNAIRQANIDFSDSTQSLKSYSKQKNSKL